MYFDHARCPHCNISFDPESIQTTGDGMVCPNCKTQLAIKSLFGLAAHLDEEEPEHVTIDDLVPGGPSRSDSRFGDDGDDDEPPSTMRLLEEFKKRR
jgi:hypothetical protein